MRQRMLAQTHAQHAHAQRMLARTHAQTHAQRMLAHASAYACVDACYVMLTKPLLAHTQADAPAIMYIYITT
jgi:hypothetical protein